MLPPSSFQFLNFRMVRFCYKSEQNNNCLLFHRKQCFLKNKLLFQSTIGLELNYFPFVSAVYISAVQIGITEPWSKEFQTRVGNADTHTHTHIRGVNIYKKRSYQRIKSQSRLLLEYLLPTPTHPPPHLEPGPWTEMNPIYSQV